MGPGGCLSHFDNTPQDGVSAGAAVAVVYRHSLVENSTIYRNRSSNWSIWLVMCRLYGRVAAEVAF